MAKRANPFIEDFVQQSKIHVGLKQFNNNEERLQKVYEKTLNLLYNGAKKSSNQELPQVSETVPHGTKTHMKQLFIGKDGSLLRSGSVVDKPLERVHCHCGSPIVEVQCGYCDLALCVGCRHLCMICESEYCSRCCIIGSDGEVCVSCYG